jgi:hypothetical protein
MRRNDPIAIRYLAVGPLYLVIATVAVHIIGSIILGVVTGGAIGVLASPFLAIFGWFVLPVELLLVSLQWYLYYACSFSRRGYQILLLVSGLLVPAFVAIVGGKEENSEIQWAIGWGLGAAVAGLSTLLVLRLIVKTISNRLEKDSLKEAAS